YASTSKFGVKGLEEAANLLKLARNRAQNLGIWFHVGTQCVDVNCYAKALIYTGKVIAYACVPLEVIDVGGGFPVSYPDSIPPHLSSYMDIIQKGCKNLPLEFVSKARVWCEPGRALVATACSLIIRVESRRGTTNILYVNDGVYGNLHEAGPPRRWKFPFRLLRHSVAELASFALSGPTSDEADYISGPFVLPSDVSTGDYIELRQFGAYNTELRTSFSGFDQTVVTEAEKVLMLMTPGLDDEETELTTN
ncbi:unnamed protein product, partial [Adineta ricciae]